MTSNYRWLYMRGSALNTVSMVVVLSLMIWLLGTPRSGGPLLASVGAQAFVLVAALLMFRRDCDKS